MTPRCRPRIRTGLARIATGLLAAATVAGAPAQTAARAPASACAEPAAMVPAQLYGLWQLTLWPVGGSESEPLSRGAMLFERHPEYPGSVRGHLKRSTDGNDTQALVSGDVVDGEFNLDESADGVTMDAVWAGAPLDCGLTLRGIRRPAEGRLAGQPSLYFRLEKTPGWR